MITNKKIENEEYPDYEKYRQMILAFLRLEKSIIKTKLANLLYLADFAWFYNNLKSMSGMQYRKIQSGPVADSYCRVIDEMYDQGEIRINQIKEGEMLISATKSGNKLPLSKIERPEFALIKEVEEKWKDKKTTEIVDFTRKQMPCVFARDNEIVSYDVFGQENPNEIF